MSPKSIVFIQIGVSSKYLRPLHCFGKVDPEISGRQTHIPVLQTKNNNRLGVVFEPSSVRAQFAYLNAIVLTGVENPKMSGFRGVRVN